MDASVISHAVRDGDWILRDYDFKTGVSKWVLYEPDGKIVMRTDYPVAQTLEENAAHFNAAGDGWKGDWHRVASVPLNLLYDSNLGLIDAHNEGDEKYVKRWLNDSDNRGFRTKGGTL